MDLDRDDFGGALIADMTKEEVDRLHRFFAMNGVSARTAVFRCNWRC